MSENKTINCGNGSQESTACESSHHGEPVFFKIMNWIGWPFRILLLCLDKFYSAWERNFNRLKAVVIIITIPIFMLLLFFAYDATIVLVRQLGYMEAIKQACRSIPSDQNSDTSSDGKEKGINSAEIKKESGATETKNVQKITLLELLTEIYRGISGEKGITCALKEFLDRRGSYEITALEKDAAEIIRNTPKNEQKPDFLKASSDSGKTAFEMNSGGDDNRNKDYSAQSTRAISYMANYHGNSLIGINIKNGVFVDSNFSRGIFKLARLENSIFSEVALYSSNFNCSNMAGAEFYTISGINESTSFAGAYAAGSIFPGTMLYQRAKNDSDAKNQEDDNKNNSYRNTAASFSHANLSCSKIMNVDDNFVKAIKLPEDTNSYPLIEGVVLDYARLIYAEDQNKYIICGPGSTGKCKPLSESDKLNPEWESTCNKLKKEQEKRGVKLCNPFIGINKDNMADTTCWVKGPNEIECTERRPYPEREENTAAGDVVPAASTAFQPTPASPSAPPPPLSVSPAEGMGGGR